MLDVSMKEDACLIHRGESAEILAYMRHLSLNMLRAETTKKASIHQKRRIASMYIGYLDKVLVVGFNTLGNKYSRFCLAAASDYVLNFTISF